MPGGANLNCEDRGFDGGDCEIAIGDPCITDWNTEGFADCNGDCFDMAWWLGDGLCDENLDCEDFNGDEGDCEDSIQNVDLGGRAHKIPGNKPVSVKI